MLVNSKELPGLISVTSAWHEGIIFKLNQNGITGKLLNLLSVFFKEQKTECSFKRKSFEVD